MRLTAIALAAAVALVGCTGAPTEPEPETASAAQFVACLKAAGVDARVGSQGHALVLVGAAPTGEPGEVVRHESSAEGEAQGWSYSEVDESGSWDAAESAAYFANDPDIHDAYAACEAKHPDFTQPEYDPMKDPEVQQQMAAQQEDELAFARCARDAGFAWVADPDPATGSGIELPLDLAEAEFRDLLTACWDNERGNVSWRVGSDSGQLDTFDFFEVLEEFMGPGEEG
jgi:hypothetical protein